MFSPLVDTIIEREKIVVVNEETIDDVMQKNGDVILFFCGDHKRLVEVDDVVVILPELVKASNGALTPVIVERESERKLQARYRFSAFPALVFLRNGEYLGAISRVLDWSDYVVEINEILSRQPSAPPAYKLPTGAATPVHAKAKTATELLIEKGAENV